MLRTHNLLFMRKYTLKLQLLLLLFFISNNLIFAVCPPTNPAITILSLVPTPADGCSNGTVTITLSDNVAEYTLISYELEGPTTIGPANFTTGQTKHMVESLPSGTYKVTIKGYCESTQTPVAEATDNVTIGGNYQVPVFSLVTTRKPLSDCVSSGLLTIGATGGVTPYRMKIISAPKTELVGKEYSFSTSQYQLGNLPAGDYEFELSDACRTSRRTYNFPAVSNPKISTANNFYIYTTPSTICNTLYSQLNAPTNDLSNDLRPYLVNGSDTVNKYFQLQWHFEDDPTVNYPISVPSQLTGSFPKGYYTFTGFDAVRGRTIVVEQMFNPDVIDGCNNTTYTTPHAFPLIIDNPTSIAPTTFIEQGTCEMGINFPGSNLNSASYSALICYPITYSIQYRTGENAGQIVPGMNSLTYSFYNENDVFNPSNRHLLAPDDYTLIANDASGATWTNMDFTISVESIQVNAPTIALDDRSRDKSKYGDDDKYTPYTIQHYNKNGWPQGTKVEFTDVPVGSEYIQKGYTITVNNSTTYLKPNPDYLYMPAGTYTYEVTTPCATPQSLTITLTEPSLNNWDYTIAAECDNFRLTPSAAISISSNQTFASVYARIASASNGNSFDSSWKKIDGSNYLTLPGAGTYRIYFSTSSTLNIHPDYFYFVRTITIDPVEFLVDESQTIAYTCPAGDTSTGIIRTAATGGTAPYTFRLQRNVGEDNNNPVFEDTGLASQTAGEGELVYFDYSDAKEGDLIRIAVTEDCSLGSTTIYSTREITSLYGKMSISGTSSACIGGNISLRVTDIPGAKYVWKFNDAVIPGETNNELVISNIDNGNLGKYTAEVLLDGCGIPFGANINVNVAPTYVLWTPTGSTEEENHNWNRPENWTPTGVPASCTDVYIPGGLSSYPFLSGNKLDNNCRNIYFMQGAEIGRPDLLTYEGAYVQLNFGCESQSHNISDLPTALTSTANYLNFSANKSTPLERDKWHMLTAPLKEMVSGNFAFGGYPLTYMKKWDPARPESGVVLTGKWSNSYRGYNESLNVGEGIILWVNEYADADMQRESGSGDDGYGLGNRSFGIKEINGILEFPYYENQDMIRARRTQLLNSNNLKFHYIWEDKKNPDYMKVAADNDVFGFSSNSSRFITEDNDNNFPVISYSSPINNNNADADMMVGNPFMSTIDFNALYNDNQENIYDYYRVWDGDAFHTYKIGESAVGATQHIPPMQAFIIATKGNASDFRLAYNIENLSAINSSGSKLRTLKQNNLNENRLRIVSENAYFNSETLIGHNEGASDYYQPSEDVFKLFSSRGTMPQIYSLTSDNNWRMDMNFISEKNIMIPIGLRTSAAGEITFTITGMNNYPAVDKIEFIDSSASYISDLTGKEVFTYSFINPGNNPIQEDRFYVKFTTSSESTSQESVSAGQIDAYFCGNNICVLSDSSDKISRIMLYDVQGRLLYDVADLNTSHFTVNEKIIQTQHYFILRIITEKNIKNVKMVRNK